MATIFLEPRAGLDNSEFKLKLMPLSFITAALILAVSAVLLSEGYHLFYCLWRMNLQSPAFLSGGRGTDLNVPLGLNRLPVTPLVCSWLKLPSRCC